MMKILIVFSCLVAAACANYVVLQVHAATDCSDTAAITVWALATGQCFKTSADNITSVNPQWTTVGVCNSTYVNAGSKFGSTDSGCVSGTPFPGLPVGAGAASCLNTGKGFALFVAACVPAVSFASVPLGVPYITEYGLYGNQTGCSGTLTYANTEVPKQSLACVPDPDNTQTDSSTWDCSSGVAVGTYYNTRNCSGTAYAQPSTTCTIAGINNANTGVGKQAFCGTYVAPTPTPSATAAPSSAITTSVAGVLVAVLAAIMMFL